MKDERRFADKHDAKEEWGSGQSLVEGDPAVPEDEGGQGDGHHGAGEDDAERVRDRHQGEAGDGAAEHQAGSQSWTLGDWTVC